MSNSPYIERQITLFFDKCEDEWLAVDVDLTNFTKADVEFAKSIATKSFQRLGKGSIRSHGTDSDRDRSRARTVFCEVLSDIDDRRKTEMHFADEISAHVDDVLKQACGGVL